MPLPDTEFWQGQEKELFDVLEPVILEGAQLGALNALDVLDIRVGFDDTLINRTVAEFARSHTLQLASDVTNTQAGIFNRKLVEWIESGEPLPALIQDLTPFFNGFRSKLIATTEVTRVFAEGNIIAWRQSGLVAGKRWQTAKDERVDCAICRPLQGIVVPLDAGFTPEGPGLGPTAPPAHPRCRCWLQPVIFEVMGLDDINTLWDMHRNHAISISDTKYLFDAILSGYQTKNGIWVNEREIFETGSVAVLDPAHIIKDA